MVQYLGYKLGLPVTTFSCSANTDEYDLLGKPISLGVTGEGDGKIVYTETELTKAIKNGWVIEIQEASVLKKQRYTRFSTLYSTEQSLFSCPTAV